MPYLQTETDFEQARDVARTQAKRVRSGQINLLQAQQAILDHCQKTLHFSSRKAVMYYATGIFDGYLEAKP